VKTLFRGLRWKLTLSYSAVTIGALLFVVLVLAIPLFSYVLAPNDIRTPEYWIESLSEGKWANSMREFLGQSPPDRFGIRLLINNIDATLSDYDLVRIGDAQLSLSTSARLEGCIVDADGNLLGVAPGELADSAIGHQPYRASAFPQLETLLQAALAGEQDPDRLSATRESDGALIVAAPVFDGVGSRKRILGAIVVVVKSLPAQKDVPLYIMRVVAASLLLFTLAAGAMGTVFGSLTARGLVDRFRRLSRAADAWSQGHFAEFVEDPSGDELGQLAQRMNLMAEGLQDLVEKRQEIAVLQERNRLARDLHDSVKQQAFATSAQLAAAQALHEQNPGAARAHLAEAERLVDQVRLELTDLIHQLRPVAVGAEGLTAAVRDYASAWAHQGSIDLDIEVQGDRALPLEIERSLFRIVQEALANAVRHSGAHTVEISLVYDAGSVQVRISDDGRGFDASQPQSGMGLRSMRERAEALGGTFTIESAPGKGTQVSVRCAC
jgi:NarL family two-component system sensor histidine kinase LiaS